VRVIGRLYVSVAKVKMNGGRNARDENVDYQMNGPPDGPGGLDGYRAKERLNVGAYYCCDGPADGHDGLNGYAAKERTTVAAEYLERQTSSHGDGCDGCYDDPVGRQMGGPVNGLGQ
jgi:hypothetical protein